MRTNLPAPADVNEYLSRCAPELRSQLAALRRVIQAAAPAAVETLAYGMPTYRQGVNLVHFAAFPQHIGFYPTPAGMTAFATEFAGYVSGKGSVQFPLAQPLPLDLVERVVRFRVAAVEGGPTPRAKAATQKPAPAKPGPSQPARAKAVKAKAVPGKPLASKPLAPKPLAAKPAPANAGSSKPAAKKSARATTGSGSAQRTAAVPKRAARKKAAPSPKKGTSKR
ncbi:MAG: DUF1801 domain-containing protein [Planctomycetaceae bacterium]